MDLRASEPPRAAAPFWLDPPFNALLAAFTIDWKNPGPLEPGSSWAERLGAYMKIMYRSNLYPTLIKSQYGPERGQYLTGFDDFGVVEKPRFRAFQRHQNHQNRLSNNPRLEPHYGILNVG